MSRAPLSILVVDDESDFLFYICKVLEQAGFTVYYADNGQKAWEIFEAQMPQIVLTDLVMPQHNGYMLAANIRKSKLPRTPIISLTGYPFRDDETRTDTDLVDLYLTKPIQTADLLTAIHICLDKVAI